MRAINQWLLAIICCLWLSPLSAATATIAVASNFRHTMEQLIASFAQQSEHQLIQVNASSGTLYNQINHGAPFAMLLSADLRYPELLADSGKGIKATLFSYAQGQLVLLFAQPPVANPVAAKQDSEQQRFTRNILAIQKRKGKIAIANPTIAPYGIAAKQVLQHLQLWPRDNTDPAQANWVRGHNVGQTFQFVSTGNAAAGFVSYSQLVQLANSDDSSSAGPYWQVPPHWYQPIRQGAILLQSARNNPAANAFLVFLQSDKAKRIIEHNGYTIPEAISSPAPH